MSKFQTKVIHLNNENPDFSLLEPAVKSLQNNQVIGLPTETVYGLAGNALSSEAVNKIFEAKRRPRDNPLICHVSSFEMVGMVADTEKISSTAKTLMDRFWPGPLTVLLPARDGVPIEVTAGLPTVAVRMPNHPIALKIIEMAGFPLAAPSANTSGKPSSTKAMHVYNDFCGEIEYIVDGGSSSEGIESTVISINPNPIILRPGALSYEKIKEIIPNVEIYGKTTSRDHSFENRPSTPGMKYRHYSPIAQVYLFEGETQKINEAINFLILKAMKSGLSYSILKTHKNSIYSNFSETNESSSQEEDTKNSFPEQDFKLPLPIQNGNHSIVKKNFIYELGNEQNLGLIAHNLFDGLRKSDEMKVDVIFVEGVKEDHEGLAIMNRLRKAASKNFVLN